MPMRYPVRSTEDWKPYSQLSMRQKLTIGWREVRRRRRARSDRKDPALTLLRGAGPASARDGALLILCVRNGLSYLPLFFEHYRRLGIDRFVVVDDGSTDGTREWLEGCPDVDLYASALDYPSSIRGALWRDGIFDLYGRGRWYVSVDVDELLIFPGCETQTIGAYIADLKRHGITRALAPMLDTYPDGPLSTAILDEGTSPAATTPLIDGDGYEAVQRKYCVSISGGPRHRLYGNVIRLTKFPVIYADARTAYLGASIHSPFPLTRNYQPATAVLLHLKFTANSVDEFAAFVAQGRHFGGAQFYRQIVESENFGVDADLRYQGAIRWKDSETLVKLGFMQDLRGGAR